MKKIILMFVLLVSCSVLFAQKVKVKKGIILVDKNEVAKIEKNKGGIYKVFDLDGKLLFSAEATSKTIKENPTNDFWLRFTGTNGNIREVERTNTDFTFSSEKIITRNLVTGPTAFLSTSGIDTSSINDFFSKTDTPISDKIDSQYAAIKERHDKEDKIAEELKLSINKDGNISLGEKIVGKIIRKEEEKNTIGFTSYTIVDLNNFIVASTEFHSDSNLTSILKGCKVKTYDKKEHIVNEKCSSARIEEDKLVNRIVKMLYANGYNIEAASENYHSEKKKKYEDSYNKALSNSVNVFNVEGYILDKKGEKVEGTISIPYENIQAKMNPNSGMADLTNYGGIVNVKNSNGKVKDYKAKNGVIVFAGDQVFVGARGVGDGGLGNNSGTEVGLLGMAQFFEVAYETTAGYILHHPKNPQYYYIMLKGNKKAYYLGDEGFSGKKPKEKMEKLFNEAVNCSALNFTDYNTLSKEGMIKILNDYTQKCSK